MINPIGGQNSLIREVFLDLLRNNVRWEVRKELYHSGVNKVTDIEGRFRDAVMNEVFK